MPRRGDNIRKRKDGRWEARYAKSGQDGLSGKYGSVYGRSYLEVKEKRDQILRHKKQSPAYGGLLFQDILQAWQDANRVRLKEASVSRYQNLIDTHILPQLGNKRVTQINAAVINRFLAEKMEKGRLNGEGGLSPAYVRSIGLVISSAIHYGASTQLCPPMILPINKPPLPKKPLSILDPQQQAQLERVLLEDISGEKLMVYLTLYTGLRIGEVCALRWEDIDLVSRLIYIRQTGTRVWYSESGRKHSRLIVGSPKTDASQRCIPICSKLQTVLGSFPGRAGSGYVLQNHSDGSFISPRTFEYRYKQLLKEADLEPINYHALRHTFATRCIERGVDMKSLSEIMGHADASITINTYVHSSIELKRIQLEKLVS